MRATRLAVLVLLVMLITGLAAVAEESVTAVVKKVKPGVVTVLTYDDAGKEAGQGTGFLTDASHVVTSYHVIEGAAKAQVKTADGKAYRVKGIAGMDAVADVVRLALTLPVKNAKPLTISKTLPAVGERIVVVGSPLGLEQTVTDGIVSAVREEMGLVTFLQVSAPISPGSSGSPVVNMKGEVVGVAYGVLTEGQNLNFAVAGRHVLALKSAETTPLGKAPHQTGDDAKSSFTKGWSYYLNGEYDKALPHFLAATKAATENEVAWLLLGLMQDTLGKYSDAVESYKQAIRIKPDYFEAYFNLGVAYGHLGKYSDAVESWKQAIRIKPDYAVAHSGLGSAYHSLGKYSDAVESYKQAIRIKPDFPEAHFNLGLAYHSLGKYSDAVESFKQAIRIKPDYAGAHLALGIAYLWEGSRSLALEEYKILKELNAEQANQLFDLIYK